VKITIKVPPRLARDVVNHAHCGYWLNNYRARLRPDGNGLHIGKPRANSEAATGTPVPTPRAFVGAAAVAEGLAAMFAHGDPKIRQCAARAIGGDADGRDMDSVLQFAAYGKLVWG
jgi:hypothetical protein